MEETKLTPMMRQYLEIKERYQDAILFFRLGDFYEMFFEDAERAAKVLDIALTARNRNSEAAVPLCGVPYHAATPYIGRLLEAGYKVAICEQVEDPRLAKGVVRREVVRVITPGTIMDGESLEPGDNNFLAAVAKGQSLYGLAVADVTTGEFRCAEIEDYEALVDEIGRIHPAEIVYPQSEASLEEKLRADFAAVQFSPVAESAFSEQALRRNQLFESDAESEKGWRHGLRAASAIVAYLEENLPEALKVLRTPQPYRASHYVMLDEMTRRNLELERSLQGDRKGSLLWVLDRTMTSMGARRIRRWILYPLMEEKSIRFRLDGVEELVERYAQRQNLRAALKGVQDLERLCGRVVSGSAGPRDLVAVKETLQALKLVRSHLQDFDTEILTALRQRIQELPDVIDLIARAIVEDAPAAVRTSGFIREGFNNELDELRNIRHDAREWIARLETQERKRTGIHSLKVRYNKVFGYSIEISKANLKLVPHDYLRKQTLVNGERYITPELKEYEAKVLTSEEESLKLELSLFEEIRQQLASYYPQMSEISRALATLDALLALAEVAQAHHFVRPQVDSGYALAVREARHPVVEAVLGRGSYIPNDCYLDPEAAQILILTGPNMAGKSTYMRQLALVVLLAQMGSFVPASEARIGLVDRIFTRIGASDSLSRGESTFMVEMREMAHIVRGLTPRSLVLLDEVGRGTSTFDGISIAWSVAEFLHDSPTRPRTLFATHYHELTDLTLAKERIKNFTFAVKEWKGEVIFLRTLVEGASNRSYGIQVARLAGLPRSVIDRANTILQNLEGTEASGKPRLADTTPTAEPQLKLFERPRDSLREDLRRVDVTQVTPIEAIQILHNLVEKAKEEVR
ncbi:MAG: DNA mismatch repair protein MutS [Candidatus Binatia bacterium]